jgi:hypothetical protein
MKRKIDPEKLAAQILDLCEGMGEVLSGTQSPIVLIALIEMIRSVAKQNDDDADWCGAAARALRKLADQIEEMNHGS